MLIFASAFACFFRAPKPKRNCMKKCNTASSRGSSARKRGSLFGLGMPLFHTAEILQCVGFYSLYYSIRYSYRTRQVSTMQMLRARDRWVQFQMVRRRIAFTILFNLLLFTCASQSKPSVSLHAEDDVLHEIIKVRSCSACYSMQQPSYSKMHRAGQRPAGSYICNA